MGLLDDAIKEHLELKRRRGADAAEITRLESEALGPVRRSADGVPDLPATSEAPDDVAQAAAPAPSARPWEDEPVTAHRLPSEPPAAYEPPPITPPPAPDLSSVTPPPPREAWMTADEPEPEPQPEPEVEVEVENESARDFDPAPESTGLLSRLRGRRSKREPQPDPEPELERLDDPDDPFEPAPSAWQPLAPLPPATHDPPRGRHEPDIVSAGEEPDVEDLLEETPEFLEETPEHDRLWFEQRPPKDFDFDG